MSTYRTAFIFTSSREQTIRGLASGREADTALRGLNHLPGADHFTIPAQSMRALPFIPRLFRYDFIIAQDNLLLGYFISRCAALFGLKTKWLYMAINSSTLMRRHAGHPLRLFLLKKFWASYAGIICLSSGQIDDFVRLGIPRSRLHLVHFGIDAKFFSSAAANPGEGDCIVSVGRDAGRDYPSLFRAAERVGHPFVVVAARKNMPPGVSIPSNVSVLYDISLAEIRDLYRRARLVVIASKDSSVPDGSDCSGQTVILDALAAGRAVVATNRPWISDYLVPGSDIVTVEPGDHEALARVIEGLWNDAPKRALIAVSGCQKVSEKYTTGSLAAALSKLMHSLS